MWSFRDVGLAAKLNAPFPFETKVYDAERIENELLRSTEGLHLAKRFFPASVSRWSADNPTAAKIFAEEPTLNCAYCGKSLLDPKPNGIVVLWTATTSGAEAFKSRHIEHLYWCCYGDCDEILKPRHEGELLVDGWESLSDLVIPFVYIRWIMTVFNELHSGITYSADAMENMKQLLINIFPLISRHVSAAERERVKELNMIYTAFGS